MLDFVFEAQDNKVSKDSELLCPPANDPALSVPRGPPRLALHCERSAILCYALFQLFTQGFALTTSEPLQCAATPSLGSTGGRPASTTP